MRASQKLHGRSSYREILVRGERLEGDLLKCCFLRRENGDVTVQAGVIVSGRVYNAVGRNRIKRLIREAFSKNSDLLTKATKLAGCSIFLVFIFKSSKDRPVRDIQLSHIQHDITKCCKALVEKL